VEPYVVEAVSVMHEVADNRVVAVLVVEYVGRGILFPAVQANLKPKWVGSLIGQWTIVVVGRFVGRSSRRLIVYIHICQ
jgi:hypothetical protein